MKDPFEVLRAKEQELLKVRKEIDALRIAATLLGDEPSTDTAQKQDLRQLIELP